MADDDAPRAWEDRELLEALQLVIGEVRPSGATVTYVDAAGVMVIAEEAREKAECALNPYAGVKHNALVTALRELLEVTKLLPELRALVEIADEDEARELNFEYRLTFHTVQRRAIAVLAAAPQARATLAKRAVDEMLQAARKGN